MRSFEREEREISCELVGAQLPIAHLGMHELIAPHLSARLPGREQHLLPNRYDIMFDEAAALGLLVVPSEGHPLEEEEDSKINNTTVAIDSTVHMSRNDAQCDAQAYSCPQSGGCAGAGTAAIEPGLD
ncbi:class II aldolase/adducin family protein, partial [Bradyrhizobium sp. SRL28]|uniref:class II aldolase/adducin family protein n=1 Tax=Bradyrhizobium sp. SRL28 TaxID=2836178 RepID=UPI001BDF712E|nr:class II aldolase/adducin family protein [Bradyrhizobium sp. SRL28]